MNSKYTRYVILPHHHQIDYNQSYILIHLKYAGITFFFPVELPHAYTIENGAGLFF